MNNNKNTILISEALVLALIPLFAYVLSFAYETASTKYLGIPPNYISLNFVDVLKLGKQLLLAFSIGVIIFWIAFFLNKVCVSWLRLVLFILLGAGIVGLYFLSRCYTLSETPRWLVASVVAIFSLGMVYYKKTTIYGLYESITFVSVFNISLSFLAMVLISYGQGYIETKSWKPYYVLIEREAVNGQKRNLGKNDVVTGQRKSVVLKMYGELVIYADLENDTIRNYTLSKYSDMKNFTVKRETLKAFTVPSIQR